MATTSDDNAPGAPQKILAVIPALAGASGFSDLSRRVVAGRSLLGWSIAAARGSRHGLRIVVATDGDDIAAEARREGAEVVRCPAGMTVDRASPEAGLLHVLEELEAKERYEPDVLVVLSCAAPLTMAEDVDGVLAAMQRAQADSAVAVVAFHQRLWRAGPDGAWEVVNHDNRERSAQSEPRREFVETGAIGAMRVSGFRESRRCFFGKTVACELPGEHRFTIDDARDLEFAELLLNRRRQAANAAALRGTRAVVFDFDGVMTDNRVLTLQDGVEGVFCDRSDGLGVGLLRDAGFRMLILSKERNPVVAARGAKLKVPVLQGIDAKRPALEAWCAEQGVALADVVYVGNDLNDVECLRIVGHPVAVADAYPEARAAAGLILTLPGGRGAVRELAELLLLR